MALVLGWFAIGAILAATLTMSADQEVGLAIPRAFALILIAFGVAAGSAARAAWRMTPAAPRAMQALGLAGAVLAVALALVVSPPVPAAKAWMASLSGGALFGVLCASQAKRLRRLLENAV